MEVAHCRLVAAGVSMLDLQVLGFLFMSLHWETLCPQKPFTHAFWKCVSTLRPHSLCTDDFLGMVIFSGCGRSLVCLELRAMLYVLIRWVSLGAKQRMYSPRVCVAGLFSASAAVFVCYGVLYEEFDFVSR